MEPVSVLAERVKRLLEEKRLSQKELSEKIGIDYTTFWRRLKGARKIDINFLRNLAVNLETSSAFLLGDVDDPDPMHLYQNYQNSVALLRDQVKVPIYANITACCGPGIDNCVVDGEIERYIPMPRSDVGNGECYGIRVVGSSMELANIPEDSIAVVNRGMWPYNGAPCHVQYIKHGFPVDAIKFFYKKLAGTVILKAANGSGVPDVEFPPGEDIENDRVLVCGVVVSVVTIQKPRQGF